MLAQVQFPPGFTSILTELTRMDSFQHTYSHHVNPVTTCDQISLTFSLRSPIPCGFLLFFFF